MFSTYDLIAFSARLKDIRKTLGYTQENVASATGLNSETLRKLENGHTIPRYDTIEILSLFYKTDLQTVLNNYKSSSELIKYYELIDYYIVGFDKSSIAKTIEQFEAFTKSNELQLIDKNELEQLHLLFKGLYLSYTSNDSPEVLQEIIQIYVTAIKACTPKFALDNWRKSKYSNIELRIIFAIASIYGHLRECSLSNDLLLFIIETLDFSYSSKHVDKLLIAKSFALISYNYHRLDDHDKALDFADQGIEYCRKHSIMSNLALLLGRKAIAMQFLGMSGFEVYYDHSLTLLKIQENNELFDIYKPIYANYLKK